MTDEHGSDEHMAHEEVPEQEHHVEAGETNVWSDEHPPVDDFADAGGTGEEAATTSQESTENDETAMGTPSKPRSKLPVLAAIGGLLLIGAVVYWQFGHSSPPPPMMPVQTSSPKSSLSSASNPKTPAPVSSAPKKMDESDINALYKPPVETGAAAPAETAPTTSMAAPEPAAPAPAMPATPAAPAATPSEPTVATAPAAPPPAAAPVPAATPAVAASPALDARMDELTTQVNSLQKSIEAITAQISQLNSAFAASQTMPPAAGQISPALEDRLNKIEQSLMQVEHKEEEAKAPAITMPEETEAKSRIVSSKPVHHRKHTPAKHRHKKAVKAVKPSHHEMAMEPLSTLPTRPSSEWVLRAATPTEAWIAADAHTPELRHVQIGDNVPGIGQVRYIRQTPSGWEIEGTAGTIR